MTSQESEAPQASVSRKYEVAVLLVLSFVNGIVALDRLAVNFLSPYIVADLGLTNAQLGLLSSALSGAISVSGLLLAAIADASGKQKKILILMLIAFSVLSSGSGLAIGFGTLFAARLLLGVAEGPLVPLTQTIMRAASHPARRGFNMGAMQIGGAFLIGAMLGPVIAVALAERFGWKAAFFASAIPGLVAAVTIALLVRDKPHVSGESLAETHKAEAGPPPSILSLLGSRNLVLSMAIAGLFTAWITIQNVFMPLYLVKQDGFSEPTMGWVLSIAGLGGMAGGIIVPALSDRFGRRPMVIASGFFSVAAPLAMLFVTQSAMLLAVLLAFAWLAIGCAPLVCAIVPGESVPASRTTTAVAMSMCTAELFGGMMSPPLAGWAADIWGLKAPFYIDIALALGCGLLALMLTETRKPHQTAAWSAPLTAQV